MPQKGTYNHVQKKTSVEHTKLYFVFTAKASLPKANEVSVLGLLTCAAPFQSPGEVLAMFL